MNKNNLLLPIVDVIAAAGALYLSFSLRFEFHIPSEFFYIYEMGSLDHMHTYTDFFYWANVFPYLAIYKFV